MPKREDYPGCSEDGNCDNYTLYGECCHYFEWLFENEAEVEKIPRRNYCCEK